MHVYSSTHFFCELLQPPKLTETQRERLLDLLAEGEPWKKQEIQNLINQEFGVEFHPNYLPRLLDDLGLSDAISCPERPDRLENAEEILDERVADAFAQDDGDEPHNKQPADDSDNEWTLDDDVRTDDGTTVGFFDISHPQPWDNSRRLYTVNEPRITRPLVTVDTPAVGFSALTGESVLQFPPNQETEQICACFEERREQNPGERKRILLVLDNFSSHVCAHTRERAHELGIDLASSFSQSAHHISTQLSRSGRVSNGSHHA